MLRQDLNSTNASHNHAADRNGPAPEPPTPSSEAVKRLDIQQSLNVLEELILESPRVPFSGRTLVDEDQLLEQLDRIRLNLPTIFQEAVQIVQQRDRIISEAHQYAQEMIAAAEQEAARRLDDLGIVQQAEARARQVKQQLEQDCDALRAKTQSEIEQWQAAAEQYWDQLKEQTETECETLQQDADAYADDVLGRIEQQLSDMMRIVRNGRTTLPGATNDPQPRSPETTSPPPKSATPPATESSRQAKQRRNAS
jgi:cell division septum initiation protein DivIVA